MSFLRDVFNTWWFALIKFVNGVCIDMSLRKSIMALSSKSNVHFRSAKLNWQMQCCQIYWHRSSSKNLGRLGKLGNLLSQILWRIVPNVQSRFRKGQKRKRLNYFGMMHLGAHLVIMNSVLIACNLNTWGILVKR
jgi:hypothetical protein